MYTPFKGVLHRFSIALKINATEPDIILLFYSFFFLVKTWRLHYPQYNSTTDSLWCVMLFAANVASSRGVGYRGLVSSHLHFNSTAPDFIYFQTCSPPIQPSLTQVTSLQAIYQTLHSSLWCHKGFVQLFHICNSTPQDL